MTSSCQLHILFCSVIMLGYITGFRARKLTIVFPSNQRHVVFLFTFLYIMISLVRSPDAYALL
jgi:hypothetical protein